jgi:predicted metal-dependent phosphotriesterase family hydrolase
MDYGCVMTKTANQVGREVARNILMAEKDILAVLDGANVNTYAFGPHYANTHTGVCGIGNLIVAIMEKAGAVDAYGLDRQGLIGRAMFLSEIDGEVRKAFAAAGLRYPASTLRVYLSNHKKGYVFGSITLSREEDAGTGVKPRTKYFIPLTPKAE